MTRISRAAAAFLALCTSLAQAGTFNSVSINGVCQVGACDFTSPVPFNTSLTENFSFTTTLGNGDMFLIAGSAQANNNADGSYLPEGVDYQVTYLGNGLGGASQADTIDVSIFAAFQTTLDSGNFGAGPVGFIADGLADGSSAYFTGYGPTSQGPFSAPGPFSSPYSFNLPPSNGAFDFTLVSQTNFAAGSAIGSGVVYGAQVPPTPEPATFFIAGSALLLLSRFGPRGRRR